MELGSSTDHARVGGAASAVPPVEQHAEIAKQRFSVITPEEASQLPEARKFLEVGIFDRIKGLFSSDQAKINAAKNLLAKPTYEVSRSVRVIADLNNLIKGLNKDIQETRPANAYSFFDENEETSEEKIQIPLINETNYEEFLEKFENGELVSELGKAGLDPTRISLFNLSVQFIVDNYAGQRDKHGEKIAGNLRELLTPAMADLVQWDNALMSMQAMTTDTLFRAVVAEATANVQGHDRVAKHTAGKAFVQENTAELWAKSGQGQFLKEVADEFAAAIEGIDSEDSTGDKVDDLFTKIDNRAQKIAGVLNLEDHEEVRDSLLNQLNQVEGFEENFKKARGQLLQIVADRQDLAKVSAPQIALITGQQQEIQNAGKKIAGSSLQGEAAIRAAFEANLSPGVSRDLTRAVGKQDQEQNLALTADDAVRVIGETNLAIRTLLAGNKDAVAEAQSQANYALNKLDLMNQLVGSAKQAELAVDTEKVNQPITYVSEEATPLNVAYELTGELLEMLDTLANGKGAHAPSPTQLEAVLKALQSQTLTETDESGEHTTSALAVVLRQEIDLNTIFARQTVDFGGQTFNVTHQDVQLLEFLDHVDSTEEAPKGINELRAQIRAVKEAREAEEAERKAPLVGTRTSEVAEQVLGEELDSPTELDKERVSVELPEQPGRVRRFFSAIGRGFQSLVAGAASANPLRSRVAVPTPADQDKAESLTYGSFNPDDLLEIDELEGKGQRRGSLSTPTSPRPLGQPEDESGSLSAPTSPRVERTAATTLSDTLDVDSDDDE